MIEPLVVRQRINAPLATVWAAWTDPDRLARWISPNPDLPTTAELDVRPGGAWTVRMGDYVVRGEYQVVRAPTTLVFTWSFDDDAAPSRVRVDLAADGDGTALTLTHDQHVTLEDRDGTAEGWALALPRLVAEFDGAAAGR